MDFKLCYKKIYSFLKIENHPSFYDFKMILFRNIQEKFSVIYCIIRNYNLIKWNREFSAKYKKDGMKIAKYNYNRK